MSNKVRFDKKTVRNAIIGSAGIKKNVYEKLGCSRQTLDNYLKKYTDLDTLLANEGDELLDVAENYLKTWVTEGKEEAIYFLLKTKGRNRGYTTRSEVGGVADGSPLVFNIIPVESA